MPSSVALIGYYGYGNFGDDLMAAIFARRLQDLGVPYSVYRLSPAALGGLEFLASDSLDRLLENRDTLVWGGGGLLVSWSPTVYRLLFPRVASDFLAVLESAHKRGLKFVAFSIGGSGQHPVRLAPEFKEVFLKSASYATVRNPQDLPFLSGRGIACEYFPDVVWQTPRFFPAAHRVNRRTTIGIDIYWRGLAGSRSLRAVLLLRNVIRRLPEYDFIVLDTSSSGRRGHPGMALLLQGPNVCALRCRGVSEVLQRLAALDLLLSSRLHSGVVCMAYGIPFVSVGGEEKTRLLLANLGMSQMYCAGRGLDALTDLLCDRSRINALLERYSAPKIEELRAQSCGHLRRMGEML